MRYRFDNSNFKNNEDFMKSSNDRIKLLLLVSNMISLLLVPNFFFLGQLQLEWEKSKRFVYKE